MKIKNNIDLIELEIFNFYDMGNCYQKYLEFGVQLYVDKQTRIITRNAPYDARYIPNKDEISDLIKADIVEDVAEEITYAYGVNLEEDIIIIEKQQKRIGELEQELAKYKDLQDQLGLENVDELEWFVMLDLLTDNEKNMHILDLHRKLAELKEKAILPKFRIGQKVWSIFVGDYKEICYLEITHIMKSKSGIFYQDSNNNAYWFNEKNTFLSEQEAQAKLKELKGNE